MQESHSPKPRSLTATIIVLAVFAGEVEKDSGIKASLPGVEPDDVQITVHIDR